MKLPGTWQTPPIPPSDTARIRAASHIARTVLPGDLGDLVHDTIKDWCEGGQRFGGRARMLRVADILHNWQTAHTLGRKYPMSTDDLHQQLADLADETRVRHHPMCGAHPVMDDGPCGCAEGSLAKLVRALITVHKPLESSTLCSVRGCGSYPCETVQTITDVLGLNHPTKENPR